jgi:hypothetical protein
MAKLWLIFVLGLLQSYAYIALGLTPILCRGCVPFDSHVGYNTKPIILLDTCYNFICHLIIRLLSSKYHISNPTTFTTFSLSFQPNSYLVVVILHYWCDRKGFVIDSFIRGVTKWVSLTFHSLWVRLKGLVAIFVLAGRD